MVIDIWISFDILRLVPLNSMSDPLMYKCHYWPRKSHDLPRNNRSSLSAHLNGLDIGLLLVQYGVHHLVRGKESVNIFESKTYHESQCALPSSHKNRTMRHTFGFREEYVLSITVSFLGLQPFTTNEEVLTMIGTQTALSTPKIMYVFQPIFLIAGGVMYTIMKLQIQFAAVEMDEPFWRALRGKISDG
jgi:hypothetical protein